MQIEVGSILEGKVTGITKFGAFVDLCEGKSGMIHISEISNSYVENVSDFLSEGQDVKVKVIAINDAGKISLSIKKLSENSGDSGKQKPNNGKQKFQRHGQRGSSAEDRGDRSDRRQGRGESVKSSNSPGDFVWKKTDNPTSFEDMMSKFKQQSDEKMSSLKRGNESAPRRPRRK